MEEHAKFSPSKLSRIIKCPGSTDLINSLMITNKISESKPNNYAIHGTKLHDILKYCIKKCSGSGREM